MPEKFRSIKAFQSYEQKSLSSRGATRGGEPAEESTEAVSPFQVLAAVKRHPKGVRLVDLASDLAVSQPAIDKALLHLLKEEMVHLEPGPKPGDDLIRP